MFRFLISASRVSVVASSMDDLIMRSADAPIPNKGPTLFYTVLIMPIVAAVFVIIRLASRWSKVRRFGIDDYCIIVAMVRHLGNDGMRIVS